MRLGNPLLEIFVAVVVFLLMTMGPLIFFYPRLRAARRQGMMNYGALGQAYAREFNRKWLRGDRPAAEPLLGSADIQSLADLRNSFDVVAGIRLTHVPYKGLAMAVMDQVSGQIPVAFNTAISVVPHIQTGRLRGIATSSRERFPLLPELPSVDESGVKGFDGGAWQGIVLPAKTPREIVMKLYGELQPMLASAETKEKFLAQGAMPSGMKPEEFAAFMKGETEKWARVAKAAGIRPE